MGLGITKVRVDPVQGIDGHHRAGRGAVRLPVLKRTGHYLGGRERGQALAGDGREFGAQFDGGDGQPAPGERHGRLPATAADLDHPVSRLETSPVDQVVKQLRRADRPGALVIRCGEVKPGAQLAAPWVIRHGFHRATVVAGRPGRSAQGGQVSCT
jgi:hypothetical protein